MIDPAAALTPAQTRDELSSLLDRARQERFRLLELLQDARAAVQASAERVAPGVTETAQNAAGYRAEVTRLIEQVQSLGKAVTARLEKLEAAEARTKAQVEHLERLELKMTNLAERFEQLVDDAREVEPVLSAAEERATQLRAAADALQTHGHDLAYTIDQRLAEQTAAFEKRLDEHHERLVTRQIQEFGSFADALARQKQAHLEQLHTELTEKRAELLAQFGGPDGDAFTDAEQDAVAKVDGLRQRLATMADEVVGDADRRGQAALDTLREQVVATMTRADDVNRTVRGRLEDALLAHGKQMEDAMNTANEDLYIRGQQLDERLAGLADLFDHQADQILDDLKSRANTMLDQMAASVKAGLTTGAADASQAADDSDAGPKLKVA